MSNRDSDISVLKIALAHIYADDNKGDLGIIDACINSLRDAAVRKNRDIFVTGVSMFSAADIKAAYPHRLLRTFIDRLVPASVAQRYIEPRSLGRNIYKSVAVPIGLVLSLLRIFLFRISGRIWTTILADGERTIAASDILVCKGGSLLYCDKSLRQNYFFLRLLAPLWQAILLERPGIILGQSVGPFESIISRFLMRVVCNKMPFLFVRDETSKAELLRIGVAEDKVRVVPDIAFYYRHSFGPVEGVASKTIGVTVRSISFDPVVQEAFEKKIASVLTTFLHAHSEWKLQFLPQVIGPDEWQDDRRVQRTVAARMPVELRPRIDLVEADLKPAELLKLYSGLGVLLANRLHSSIFASVVGVPAVVLEYQQKKAEGAFQHLGLSENVVAWYEAEEVIQARIEYLLHHRGEIVPHLASRIDALVGEIEFAADEIIELAIDRRAM